MKLIVPAAGKSSRFPNMRPKWLLTHPNGNVMITESIKGLDLHKIDEIIIIVLKEHIDKYQCKNSVIDELSDNFPFKKINMITLLESRSQSETVYRALKENNIRSQIFIKDCDNTFSAVIGAGNSVCSMDISEYEVKNLINKSYLSLNKEKKNIESITEKQIVSNNMCISGYSFEDSNDFIKSYEQVLSLESEKEIYISHVINNLILNNGMTFEINEAKNFIDWGTAADWKEFVASYKTYFVDIDGVLFENASKHFYPKWGESKPLLNNIDIIKKLYESKRCEIVLTTSRNEEYKEATIRQLELYSIKYKSIIFGLQHNQRIIINDFSNGNPFPSCFAINIERNSDSLNKIITP